MKIALDFDDTYTKDPELWEMFIERCDRRGHEIMVVTFRDPGIPIEQRPGSGTEEGPINVYYTSYRSKRTYMKDQGIDIDVWIDDSPETIVADSSWTNQERERWKEEHAETISNRFFAEPTSS